MIDVTGEPAIIHLRQSDFRDDDDLEARRRELRELADELGVTVLREVEENDVGPDGRVRGTSAYKARDRVTVNGLKARVTRRPTFDDMLLDLQAGRARVLLVGDPSRLSRDWRDAANFLDACAEGKITVAAPGDDGPVVILTAGGTRAEVKSFKDDVDAARRYSDDISRKVSRGRRRHAGESYQGGRRPYGYQIRQGTEQYARNLDIDAAEAAVLTAAADRLLAGDSLKGLTADLRERQRRHEPGCATLSGSPWTTRSLRGALIKPAVAGLQWKDHKRGVLVTAPWEPVFDREKWDQLRALLTDPARRTNTGRANAPRWLVSVWARCGVCGGLLRVGGAGNGRGPAYVGQDCGHIRRDALKVDELVAKTVIAWLEEPDTLDLLRPPARPGVDVTGLRDELGDLADRRGRARAMWAAGTISDADLAAIVAHVDQRSQDISEELAASAAAPDPLAEFHEAPARVAWDALPLSRKRAVVQRVCASVVIMPAGRGGRFDPAQVDIQPSSDLAR